MNLKAEKCVCVCVYHVVNNTRAYVRIARSIDCSTLRGAHAPAAVCTALAIAEAFGAADGGTIGRRVAHP